MTRPSFNELSFERIYTKIHPIKSSTSYLALEVKDFRLRTRVLSAETVESQSLVEAGPSEIQYGQSPLPSDRHVRARLEIDWLEGTPRPLLQANISDGSVRLEDLLAEVGIELEVIWSNELPKNVMGNDGRFSDDELLSTMEQYRNEEQGDIWHFYLIFGGQYLYSSVYSTMFDTKLRRGGVLFDVQSQFDKPRLVLRAAIHEIGHMLNLPHPWQAYGDTLSAMTYPYRWGDKWSFDDPEVYRFDAVAQQHIRRSPERYVRPGRSAFLEYGTRQSWVIASQSR